MRTRAIEQFPLNGGASCTDPLAEISHCGEICMYQTENDVIIIMFNFGAGPSKFVMVTTGIMSPYRPHFFSLSPEENPLPSCLTGIKQTLRGVTRFNAALFAGEGMYIFRA